MHPKIRSHNGYLPATESRKTTQKLNFGPKQVDWACSLRKTRCNFGSTKWSIVCTPKPDLTTYTSRQRNRAKPPRNLVLGLKKWIGHVRCEKKRRNFGSTKWCISCTPKPDLTTSTSRQRNRVKPPKNLVLGINKWIGHVRCEKQDATSEAQSGALYAPQNPISQLVPPGNEIARNHPETLFWASRSGLGMFVVKK